MMKYWHFIHFQLVQYGCSPENYNDSVINWFSYIIFMLEILLEGFSRHQKIRVLYDYGMYAIEASYMPYHRVLEFSGVY